MLHHGSDLSLAAAITPFVQTGRTIRSALDELVRCGVPAVQLDATLRGIRPRELSRRSRRDLSALLVRQSLRLAGVDLFIPRRHFVDAEHIDRAAAAAVDAVGLAADLGRVPLSLAMPIEEVSRDVTDAILEAADRHSVPLAVHAEDQADVLEKWLEDIDLPNVGAGIDPAALLARKVAPDEVVHRLSRRLTSARLSDASMSSGEGTRCVVGRGELDIVAYRVALDLAAARRGPVVLDVRGLTDPSSAVRAAVAAWERAAFRL